MSDALGMIAVGLLMAPVVLVAGYVGIKAVAHRLGRRNRRVWPWW